MSLNVDDFRVLRRSSVPTTPPSGFDTLYTKSSGLYIVDSSGNEYRVITADSSGWVGIGTTTPTTMLDVNGQIRIRGGSPGANKILISDENGFGSWSAHSVISHGSLSGLSNDDHTQYLTTGRHDTTARHGSSVVDHGSIGGLGDDDHTQYLNNARHDTTSRHPIGTVVPHDNHSFLDGLDNDDHPQYLNITRHDMTTRHGSNVVDHGSIGGLGDDDHPQYLNNARHDTTSRHTPGAVVPVVQTIPTSDGSDQIPSAAAVRDAINNRIAAGSTTNALPIWDGSKWAQSSLGTLSSSKLYLNRINASGESEILLSMDRLDQLSSDTSADWVCIHANAHSAISAGVTNSGSTNGMLLYAHRDSTNDDGTLQSLQGICVIIGHSNTLSTPITTYAMGLNIVPRMYGGTIDNLYQIYLDHPRGTGTITKAWGIYQLSDYNNYLGGRLGVKTYPNSYDLQLANDSAAKPSTNTWAVTSDRRAKNQIVDADLDRCLQIVKSLPLRYFRWKDEYITTEQASDRGKLGWISDEVEPFFPKAVTVGKFAKQIKKIVEEKDPKTGEIVEKEIIESEDLINDFKYLNADQIYAAMYGAVQKLIQIVEKQQEEIVDLKRRLGVSIKD